MKTEEIVNDIKEEVDNLFNEYLSLDLVKTLGASECQLEVIQQKCYKEIFQDLVALVEKDPAARGAIDYVLKTYDSFKAVMYYRVANEVYNADFLEIEGLNFFISRKISEHSKTTSKIEIHPASTIGHRFVIDHGIGTVIGETAVIGDDCYILQGVILGSANIANNPMGKRHPTVGDNVEIGAFAKIFGPICIGSNVVISPNCVITQNIPDNSRVSLVNQIQITSIPNQKSPKIYGLVPKGKNEFALYGEMDEGVHLSLVDENYEAITWVTLNKDSCNKMEINGSLTVDVASAAMINNEWKKWNLKITEDGDSYMVLLAGSLGLQVLLKELFQGAANE